MKIIIDSADGCGKTTLIEKLMETYKTDIIRMTKPGCKLPLAYVQKATLDEIISDRSFISEYIYSSYYKRKSFITKEVFEKLLSIYRDFHEWKIVLLCCDPDEIINRINTRGCDKEKIEDMRAIDSMYRTIALTYNIPIIDTTNLTQEEVFEKAKEIIDAEV